VCKRPTPAGRPTSRSRIARQRPCLQERHSRPATCCAASLGAALVAALLATPATCATPVAGAPRDPRLPTRDYQPPTTTAPFGAAIDGLVNTTLAVPAGATAPYDVPRQVLLPPGWTIALWARVPEARLAAWAPDGALLVSQPAFGTVLRLRSEEGGAAAQTTLLGGLVEPHGLAFHTNGTLYVAESDALTAYVYADGAATQRRVVAGGLPNSKSADLGGAYAHALKSIAVDTDGTVYISIGSATNVSPSDRTSTPERASVLRLPASGGPLTTFARGVRNGVGLAFAPDGKLWTAVNNRDDIAYPHAGPWGNITNPTGMVRALPSVVSPAAIQPCPAGSWSGGAANACVHGAAGAVLAQQCLRALNLPATSIVASRGHERSATSPPVMAVCVLVRR
jgi:hypothetical protein